MNIAANNRLRPPGFSPPPGVEIVAEEVRDFLGWELTHKVYVGFNTWRLYLRGGRDGFTYMQACRCSGELLKKALQEGRLTDR